MDYNTQRKQIVLKEYGRNIQDMAYNLINIEEKENRSKQAAMLVELMKQFTQPGIKDNNDFNHKVWDDLHVITDFKLDIEGPFPKPDISVINKKPEPLSYSVGSPKFRHIGRNVELLAKKIAEIEATTDKENASIYLGRLVKNFHSQYSKETVEDVVIKEQVYKMSGGQITLDLEKIKAENLLETSGFRTNDRDQRPEGMHRNNNHRNNNHRNNRNNNGGGMGGNNKNNKKRRK